MYNCIDIYWSSLSLWYSCSYYSIINYNNRDDNQSYNNNSYNCNNDNDNNNDNDSYDDNNDNGNNNNSYDDDNNYLYVLLSYVSFTWIYTFILILAVTLSIGTSDTLQGLWNTVAGGNGSIATPGSNVGNYVTGEGPPNAFDGNCNSKYLSFGPCYGNGPMSCECGTNTGFHVTLFNGAVSIKSLRFCAANDYSTRDPITMTLEGSNQTGSALFHGSSWTLIYNGSCGLDTDPGRSQYGQFVRFSYNTISYTSYRILLTSKRGVDCCLQYGEVTLFAS